MKIYIGILFLFISHGIFSQAYLPVDKLNVKKEFKYKNVVIDSMMTGILTDTTWVGNYLRTNGVVGSYTAGQGLTLTGTNFTLGGSSLNDITIKGVNSKLFRIGSDTELERFGSILLEARSTGFNASSVYLNGGALSLYGYTAIELKNRAAFYDGDYTSQMTTLNYIPNIKKVTQIVEDSIDIIKPKLLPSNTTGEVVLLGQSATGDTTLQFTLDDIGTGGGNTYANNGLYKDGDTIKWGGQLKYPIGMYYPSSLGAGFDISENGLTLKSLSKKAGGASLTFLGGNVTAEPVIQIQVSGSTSGTGDDIEINIDSTGLDFKKDGDIVARIDSSGSIISGTNTNNATLSASTGIRLKGTATVYDEMQFDLNSLKSIGVTAKPDYSIANLTFGFPQNDTTEIMGTAEELPHWWKEGSSAYFMVHFDQTQNLTPIFRVQYKVYNIGDNEPSTWSLVQSSSLAVSYTSGTMGQVAKFPGIILTGKTIGATLKVRVYRKDNVYTGDCLVTRFGLHLEKDALGSSTEYTK